MASKEQKGGATPKKQGNHTPSKDDIRKARLSENLRQNLKRRKTVTKKPENIEN